MEILSFSVPNRSKGQTAIEVTITALLFIFAVWGNLLLCFAIYKKRNLRTIPNAFFLNLAVSNLLLTLSQLPILVDTIVRGEWSLGERFCHFCAFLDIALFSMNLFTLTVIGVNRYFKIVKPNRYGNVFFRKSVIFVIVFIWCLAITLCSGPFLGWGKYQFIPLKSLCSISENAQSSFRIMSSVIVSCCIFMIIACHVKIAQVVRHHRRRIVTERKPPQNEGPLQLAHEGLCGAIRDPQELRGEDVHIARTVSVIVVLFCLCWVPNAILDILVSRGVHVTREVRMFGVYMMFLDLVINPTVYGMRNREIRNMLKRLFHLD
ncbi:G-protein coupled receptor 161-like [Orbicella faveolata]|uniref:G-protein coupled receptor 161-like n=1 Tax=Orbicella faveolata TaxID=48498 RepID=UPI0009E202A0|nr:G-protein coupled receptor 161-like [Orbicella faveolata]